MQRSLKRSYRQDVWNLFLTALCGRDKNKAITRGLNSVRLSVRLIHNEHTNAASYLGDPGYKLGLETGENEGFPGLCHFTAVNTGMVF
jgi:hypothetical protein